MKTYFHGLGEGSPRINLVDAKTAAVAPMGLLVNGQPSWSMGKWSFEGNDVNISTGDATLQFTGEVDGLRVVRELTFYANTYKISEKIRIAAVGDQARAVRLAYTMAEDSSAATGGAYDGMRIAWSMGGACKEDRDAKDLAATGVQAKGQVLWASAMRSDAHTSEPQSHSEISSAVLVLK